MRRSTVIGILLILGFVTLGAVAFMRTATPYVTVEEAKTAQDIVQVYGAIDQTQLKYDRQTAEIRFPLTDLGNHTMEVRYHGVRPGNMAQASHCVATGQWTGDHFEASSLLIKCPSKYQGEKKT